MKLRRTAPSAVPRWASALALAAWLLPAAIPTPAAAQFNPGGRARRPSSGARPTATPRQPQSKPTGTGSQGTTAAGTPKTGAASASSATVDPTVRRDELIERYFNLVLQKPGEATPLRRLLDLVRQRDGNVDQLVARLKAAAETTPSRSFALDLALAGVEEDRGQLEVARTYLEAATQKEPSHPAGWLARARIEKSTGNLNAARQHLERAQSQQKGTERELTLRQLRTLSLDLGDYEAASRYQAALTKNTRGNIYLEGELGRELLARGENARAVDELQRVVAAAHGDARAEVPALRDLGQAQLAAGRTSDAIVSLDRASRLATAQPGLQIQIDRLRADAHRQAGTLPAFLADLDRSARSHQRLALVGRLHEEQGNTDAAIKAYEKALRRKSSDIDIRLRLVRLHELSGHLDAATDEYAKLTRQAPDAIDLSLRYMEMLLARGQRDKVLAHFDRTARRLGRQPDAALVLMDFAERIGEPERADRIGEQLRRQGNLDARQLVDLGAHAFRSGDTEAAFRIWKRILTSERDRARAHVTYGEVLLDHDRTAEGVAALVKAAELAPQRTELRRSLALGLMRAATQESSSARKGYQRRAIVEFERLIGEGSSDPAARRRQAEARRHLVRLYRRSGQLAQRMRAAKSAFVAKPPDLAAGRLLAEMKTLTGETEEAARILSRLLEISPGDIEALATLERLQAQDARHAEAIETLKRLVQANPKRAREYYERMARHALWLKRDTEAVDYARRAASLDPDDAEAQARLGDLYAKKGQYAKAEAAYRLALSRDDRLQKVRLDLARLLARRGSRKEALEHTYDVLRGARQDEIIALAGRLGKSLALSSDQGRALEDTLRPLVVAQPDRPIYRRLLLETLAAESSTLQRHLEAENRSEREVAEGALANMATRNLQPLLLALAGDRPEERLIAVELLAFSTSTVAGTALLEFAATSGKQGLRVAAIRAASRQKNAELVPRFEQLLTDGTTVGRGPVAQAATAGLAAVDGLPAMEGLVTALNSPDPNVRAEAVLGLGHRPNLSEQRLDALLLPRLESAAEGALVRAAAAHVLALRNVSSPRLQRDAALALLVETGSPLERAAAVQALAYHDSLSARWMEDAIEALLSEDPRLQRAAISALSGVLPTSHRGDESSRSSLGTNESVEARLWQQLSPMPSAATRLAALERIEHVFVNVAQVTLATSRAGSLRTLAALERHGPQASLRPLYDTAAPGERWTGTANAQAAAIVERIVSTLSEQLVEKATSSDTEVRAAALRALSPRAGDAMARALEQGLQSEEDSIFEASLMALVASPSEKSLDLLEHRLLTSPIWSRRRRLAIALEMLAQPSASDDGEGNTKVKDSAQQLLQVLATDKNGLVRARAQTALDNLSPSP